METAEISLLAKIHADLEVLKQGMDEIRHVIRLEPELSEEAKIQLEVAREKLTAGKVVSNEDMLREFGLR